MIRAFNTLRLAALFGATALLVGCAADLDADEASIAESVSEALVVEAEDELTWREELEQELSPDREDEPSSTGMQAPSRALTGGDQPSVDGNEVMGEPPPIPWYPCKQREAPTGAPDSPHQIGAGSSRTAAK